MQALGRELVGPRRVPEDAPVPAEQIEGSTALEITWSANNPLSSSISAIRTAALVDGDI